MLENSNPYEERTLMLLIDKNQKFSITLLYKKSQNDDLEILTKEPEEGEIGRAHV
jgi:hypothetical protein